MTGQRDMAVPVKVMYPLAHIEPTTSRDRQFAAGGVLGCRGEPERPPIPDRDLLTRGNRPERDQRHLLIGFAADDLRIRRLGVVAERDDAEDYAGALSAFAE